MPTTRATTTWSWLALALALTVGWSGRADGHDIRVGTRTDLTANVRAAGTLVTVDGFLRDNLGQGIEGEAIKIDFAKAVDATGPIARDLRTDRTGRFYVTLTLPPGRYDGTIRYSGREFYYAPVERRLDPVTTRRGELELTIRAPALALRANERVRVAVAATSAAQPVPGLQLSVYVSGSLLKLPRTEEDGTVIFPLELSELPGSTAQIVVQFDGDERFEADRKVEVVRILDAPTLSSDARAIRARLQRGVAVSGVLGDRAGGVTAQEIDVILSQGGEELERFRARTDEEGKYGLFISEDRYEAGELTVQSQVVLPGGSLLEATPLTLEVEKTGLTGLPWLLVSLLGVFGAVLGVNALRDWWGAREERPEKAKKPRVSPQRARRPSIVAVERAEIPSEVPEGATRIAGVLWDRQRREPLREGEVAILTTQEEGQPAVIPATPIDADGAFSFGPLSPGAYVLRATARGFVSASYRFTIPHSGELRYFRFPLTPVRVVVRDLYAELSDELLEADEGAWGRLTPREVSERLLEAVESILSEEEEREEVVQEGLKAFRALLGRVLDAERGDGPALSSDEVVKAFVTLTEEVYYSQRLHDEEIITVAERLASRVREHVEEWRGR
ncbi:MAG: hypothetical protein CMH57_06520 [Myxococcales bacterium]|nr:hypothetical protein [Myxococcales bacterium]